MRGTLGGMAEVEVLGVGTEAADGERMLLLQERGGVRRCLPIWVGRPEAIALNVAKERAVTSRPLTHRLLLDVLDAFEVALERVRITSLVAGQFHAELDLAHLGSGGGSTRVVSVSARAGDAVALALGHGCAIEVDEAVLDEASLPVDRVVTADITEVDQAGGVEPLAVEDEVERLRRALDAAGPEGFGPRDTGPDDDSLDGPT